MATKALARYVSPLLLTVAILLTAGSGLAQEERRAPVPGPLPCPEPWSQTITLNQSTAPYAAQADFAPPQWNAPRAVLNDPGIDKHFLHTFRWEEPHKCCQITGAQLTVNMRANQAGASHSSSDAGNDGIVVMNGGSVLAGLSAAVYPNTPFAKGFQVTKTWSLPAAALTVIDQNHRLSFDVQDDTAVLSATLQLNGCCLSKK